MQEHSATPRPTGARAKSRARPAFWALALSSTATEISTRVLSATLVVLVTWAALAVNASAQQTSAVITASLSPDQLGANAALNLRIQYSGGQFGVPAAVRRAVLRLPGGMSLNIPRLRSCSAAHLLSHGPSGCPARARLGAGYALAEARAGSQIISETFGLSAFLGPPRNSQPTLEILAQGHTPFDERVLLTATVLPAHAPYGEELVLPIPTIPTLPLEPGASMVTFSLTIGTGSPRVKRSSNTILVPRSCPVGGFPFAAEFAYVDDSTGSALGTARCP